MTYLLFVNEKFKPFMIHERYFDLPSNKTTLERKLTKSYYDFSTRESDEIIEPWNGFSIDVSYDKITFSGDNGIIEYNKTDLIRVD